MYMYIHTILLHTHVQIPDDVDNDNGSSEDVGNIPFQYKMPINTTLESSNSFIGTGPVDMKKAYRKKEEETNDNIDNGNGGLQNGSKDNTNNETSRSNTTVSEVIIIDDDDESELELTQ